MSYATQVWLRHRVAALEAELRDARAALDLAREARDAALGTMDTARDCFLEACGTADEFTSDTELGRHDVPVTKHVLVVGDFEFRQLVQALGIVGDTDEPTRDAILRQFGRTPK